MSARNGRSKYAPVPGNIPGIDITLSGVTLTLAPINLNQVKALQPLINKLGSIEGAEIGQAADVIVPIVYAAAVRNHPEITEDDVRDLLDVGNMRAAVDAALGVGGYEKGEGKPAATSTGTTLSPASSPPPAGPGSTAASS